MYEREMRAHTHIQKKKHTKQKGLEHVHMYHVMYVCHFMILNSIFFVFVAKSKRTYVRISFTYTDAHTHACKLKKEEFGINCKHV